MGVVEGCCGNLKSAGSLGREGGTEGPAGGHAHAQRSCSLAAQRLGLRAVVLAL